MGGLCCCSKGVINSQLRLGDPRRGRWEIVVTVSVDGTEWHSSQVTVAMEPGVAIRGTLYRSAPLPLLLLLRNAAGADEENNDRGTSSTGCGGTCRPFSRVTE